MVGRLHKDNQGFAYTGLILLVVVVIAAVGGVGYYVMTKNKDKNQYRSNDSTAQPSSDTSSNSSAATHSSSEFMEVKEFGVKVRLSDPINDAYYVIKTSSDGKKYATISTRTLAKEYPGCAAESDGYGGAQFGYINSFTDPNSPDPYSGAYTMKETFPDAVNVNGKYYYLATNHQAPCDSGLSMNSGGYEVYHDALDAFDAAKKLEKL